MLLEFKLSPTERVKFDGLRDRASVVQTLRGDWGKGDGMGLQMVLIALLPDDTPAENVGGEEGQNTSIGDLAADALVKLSSVGPVCVLLVEVILKLEQGKDPNGSVESWNQLVGTTLYDSSEASAGVQRMIECLKAVLRRDDMAFVMLSALIEYGETEKKYRLGCLGLKYRRMADDIEQLIKLLRKHDIQTEKRIIGALKSVTGKSFLFGENNSSKWEKWLTQNRHALY